MNESEQSRRRTYGRGIVEGLRMAGIANPGDFMNAAKLARMESSLNAMEKKVLSATPIQDTWSKDQIFAEMKRMGGGAAFNVVEACLSSLVDKSLAKEPRRGYFLRVTAKTVDPTDDEQGQVEEIKSNTQAPASAEAKPNDTLGRLANVALLLRRAADEIESIAMEVEDRVADAGRDGEKLRRLQLLLKDISGGS